ncbi:hypothetical protein ACFWP3_31185 [Streptomyces sp. NPDC058525]|uniref:hypothetical protein n=1 Tax=Streptomyces sp. NPDC058525 TaxID=3346538 RepID=UPI00366637A1
MPDGRRTPCALAAPRLGHALREAHAKRTPRITAIPFFALDACVAVASPSAPSAP